MNYVMYTDSPKIEDTVGFILETYDDNGVLKNPYLVEKVSVYYIEKNAHHNERSIELKDFNPDLEETYKELSEEVETAPSEEGIGKLKSLKIKLDSTAKTRKFFYSDSKLAMETPSPLWTQDLKTKGIANFKNEQGKSIDGKFIFIWLPKDVREGSYVIRWSWKSSKDGKSKFAEKLFTLYPAEQKLNSVYRKFVPREKYNFLFDKYIPPMYRIRTTPNDITPQVLTKLNKAVAQCLLELDDLAVGLVDMLNPTYIPEGFLPVMANMFNLELRSSNPTAWRNQIKHAMPLYKKKGTIEGLQEAFDKAGIRFIKLTNLWQVVSPYTWVDGFVIDKDVWSNNEVIGHLSRRPLKEDPELEIFIKSANTKEYFQLPSNVIYLQDTLVPEPKIALIWNGSANNPPIELFKGDVIKVRYKYNKIPKDAQSLEDYIESLPLSDQRDERKVKYPMKNWNVKLIEEDDPLFDLLIPERNAFHNPVTYGKIRTTFLYSEKAFNMDTYNGSLYNSNNPCDMDKDFLDQCSGSQSSKFNIHLEFNQVDDDKIAEAKEIIIDYSPFHAILHKMKISSRVHDIVLPPVEKVKSEVKKKAATGEKIGCAEAIYCQIKYKNGKVESGRIV